MDLDVITINTSVIIKCSVYHENQASVYISLASILGEPFWNLTQMTKIQHQKIGFKNDVR